MATASGLGDILQTAQATRELLHRQPQEERLTQLQDLRDQRQHQAQMEEQQLRNRIYEDEYETSRRRRKARAHAHRARQEAMKEAQESGGDPDKLFADRLSQKMHEDEDTRELFDLGVQRISADKGARFEGFTDPLRRVGQAGRDEDTTHGVLYRTSDGRLDVLADGHGDDARVYEVPSDPGAAVDAAWEFAPDDMADIEELLQKQRQRRAQADLVRSPEQEELPTERDLMDAARDDYRQAGAAQATLQASDALGRRRQDQRQQQAAEAQETAQRSLADTSSDDGETPPGSWTPGGANALDLATYTFGELPARVGHHAAEGIRSTTTGGGLANLHRDAGRTVMSGLIGEDRADSIENSLLDLRERIAQSAPVRGLSGVLGNEGDARAGQEEQSEARGGGLTAEERAAEPPPQSEGPPPLEGRGFEDGERGLQQAVGRLVEEQGLGRAIETIEQMGYDPQRFAPYFEDNGIRVGDRSASGSGQSAPEPEPQSTEGESRRPPTLDDDTRARLGQSYRTGLQRARQAEQQAGQVGQMRKLREQRDRLASALEQGAIDADTAVEMLESGGERDFETVTADDGTKLNVIRDSNGEVLETQRIAGPEETTWRDRLDSNRDLAEYRETVAKQVGVPEDARPSFHAGMDLIAESGLADSASQFDHAMVDTLKRGVAGEVGGLPFIGKDWQDMSAEDWRDAMLASYSGYENPSEWREKVAEPTSTVLEEHDDLSATGEAQQRASGLVSRLTREAGLSPDDAQNRLKQVLQRRPQMLELSGDRFSNFVDILVEEELREQGGAR